MKIKTFSEIQAVITWLVLLVCALLTIIDLLCFQRSFYRFEYQKGAQAEKIGMSDADLMNATDTLLDYLQDRRNDIIVTAEVNGYEREVFSEREKLHMVDVKNLYQSALLWRNILAIAGGAGLLFFLLNKKKPERSVLYRAYKTALMMFIIFLLFVSVSAIADFDTFWIRFHYIFFDNDLFFLDPNTSIMINMFPSRFFSDIVMAVIILFVLVLAAVFLLLKKTAGEKTAI